jgi:polyvinyl alcohol dehydrogenase (cytochrome)
MRWAFQARTAVRSGVAYADAKGTPTIFFGDARANVYAVNGETGRLIWIVRPQEPREALATAAPRYYKGAVYQPFSSYEELLAAGPNYHCCTFRGNVVALDAGTGKTIWQTFTIPETAKSNANLDPRSLGSCCVVESDNR